MNNFKVGDKVVCIDGGAVLNNGQIYIVLDTKSQHDCKYGTLYEIAVSGYNMWFSAGRFKPYCNDSKPELRWTMTEDGDMVLASYNDFSSAPQNNPSGSAKLATSVKLNLPERYIINKGATILFWRDSVKTVVKMSSDDKYDKRLGFLYAYFQKTSGLSRNKANKFLHDLQDEDDIENAELAELNKNVKQILDRIEVTKR